ncbi:MAG: trigger factor [Patescibacteria group bacterium]
MIKKLSKSKIEISFILPWEEWKDFLDKASAQISEEIKVDGFRPGKAPRNLVEQKVGQGYVLEQGARMAVEKKYLEYAAKEKLEVLGQPEIEITDIKDKGELKFKVTTAVMPEAKVSAKFESEIKKINEQYQNGQVEIKDEEIEAELKNLANSRVKLVTVRREARKDDSVEIDFDVLVGGVLIENGSSKNHPLILGRGVFIPGFEDNVVGMKEGEEKEFELAFPENYHKKDLAGKPATFKVKLNLVQERQVPEINDEFAVSLGNFKDLSELRKNIREGIEHEAKHKRDEEKRAKYLEAIVAKTEVDLPEVLVEEEIDKMLREFEYQVQSMGLTLDKYLAQIKKDQKELRKDWEEQARKRVVSALSLRELVKMKDIAIPSEEIEKEMNKTLAYYKNVKDIEKNIDLERLFDYTRNTLENEKVFEMLGEM